MSQRKEGTQLPEVFIGKVMSWLEGLAQDDWREFHSDSEVQNIAKASLKLLKERKHGKWTTHRTQQHDGEWYCDKCDYEPTVFEATPYCPNCGAMMELDK